MNLHCILVPPQHGPWLILTWTMWIIMLAAHLDYALAATKLGICQALCYLVSVFESCSDTGWWKYNVIKTTWHHQQPLFLYMCIYYMEGVLCWCLQSLWNAGGVEGTSGHGTQLRSCSVPWSSSQPCIQQHGRWSQHVRWHQWLLFPRQRTRWTYAVGKPTLQLHRVSVFSTVVMCWKAMTVVWKLSSLH